MVGTWKYPHLDHLPKAFEMDAPQLFIFHRYKPSLTPDLTHSVRFSEKNNSVDENVVIWEHKFLISLRIFLTTRT